MRTAIDRACRWERETPDSVWLTQPWGGGAVRDLTWRDGMDQARRIAGWLRSLELPAGSRVAILSKNCAHWILADLAIWMAGHVSVPLYSTASAATVAQLLEHSEARVLFAGKHDSWDAVKPAVPEAVRLVGLPPGPPIGESWESLCAAHAPLAGDVARGADELATIVYTSGSTGTPKGVMLSFGAMARASDGGSEMFAVRREDRMLSHLPLAHVAERALVEMGSLAHGFRVYFVDRLETFAEDLRRARPTLFFTVPRLWQKFQLGVLAKVPPEKLERLLSIPVVGWLVKRKILRGLGLGDVRLAGSGAAPMPADLLVWYRRLGLELLGDERRDPRGAWSWTCGSRAVARCCDLRNWGCSGRGTARRRVRHAGRDPAPGAAATCVAAAPASRRPARRQLRAIDRFAYPLVEVELLWARRLS
jgi:long-subunit acyl-CoA synthetase (AMP-forming)